MSRSMWTGMEMNCCCRIFSGRMMISSIEDWRMRRSGQLLKSAIDRLSPREKTIVELRYGLKNAEG